MSAYRLPRRSGTYEIMIVGSDIRNLIAVRADVDAIRSAAISHGMTTMLADGIIRRWTGYNGGRSVKSVKWLTNGW